MHRDPRTRTYVERRTAEGPSKKEIMRCLKRFVAREIYAAATHLSRLERGLTHDTKWLEQIREWLLETA